MEQRNVKIRRAGPEDAGAVYRLICEMEKEELDWRGFQEIYMEQWESKGCCCLVAEPEAVGNGGSVIGCLNLRMENQLHHAGRIAEIMELAVAGPHQSGGVGAQLFHTACKMAQENGCMLIEVASNQVRRRAHGFYERHGMQKTHYKLTRKL